MSKDGIQIIDADFHVVEPPDLWSKRLPRRWRDHAPIGTEMGVRDIGVVVAGGSPNRRGVNTDGWNRALQAHMAPREVDYDFARRGWDGETHLEAMDREGIDRAVLFPSRGLFVLGYDTPGFGGGRNLEPELATAIAHAYNDWLAELCAAEPGRLVGAAMVAPHDVSAAAAEVERCVDELGFKAVFLLPGVIGGREWHHRDFDPLWAACESGGVPVCFHGGGPDELTDFGLGHRDNLMMWHTFSHSLGPMSALASFCAGGVLDRFPFLRAAFLEANCSWAPWLLHRLDEHYKEYVGRYEVTLERLPSEAFSACCFVSVEADEKPASLYVQVFGDHNVVFSTDFPHPDSKFPLATDAFLGGDLTRASKERILWDNAVRLYGFEVEAGVQR